MTEEEKMKDFINGEIIECYRFDSMVFIIKSGFWTSSSMKECDKHISTCSLEFFNSSILFSNYKVKS